MATKKIIPENKFETLKVHGMTTLSFTGITAVVGRDYEAINASNKDESFLVRCSQSMPYNLVRIDKEGGDYLPTT
jgi:hypothetical protein